MNTIKNYRITNHLIDKIMFKKMRDWHGNKITEIQKRFGLTNYQILWISFLEGIFIGIVLGHIFFAY